MNNGNNIPITWKTCAYAIVITFTVLTLAPMIWLFYTSFKTNSGILHFPLSLPNSENATFTNYIRAWGIGNMAVALLNSFIYTGFSTGGTLILAMAAAFGLAKFPNRSKGLIYGAFTGGLLISAQAVIIPLFLMEVKLGFNNTRIGLILPYIAFDLPMSILIAYSFISALPDALIEAAVIDGASYPQIFFKLIFPMSVPVIATMVILSFLKHWNEFMLALILTTGNKMSLPVAISQFAGGLNVDYGMQFASLVISIIPIIVFYAIFHEKLIKGFAEGAIKE